MNLAIIGCGDAAQAVALAARFVPGVRIRSFVDLSRDRAARMARGHRHVTVETRWEAVCEDDGIDAAYVAVPHALHPEVALGVLASGKAVLLEKPLAESVSSATELIERMPQRSRLGVNYQWRYDPRAWAIVEAARAGAFGDIAYVEVSVPWYRESGYFEAAPWHGKRAVAGGGTLLTQGSHALDIALLCTGPPVAAMGATYNRVFTASEVEDLAAGIVETSSGTPVIITSSMSARPGHTSRIAVYGTRGSAVYLGPQRARVLTRGVAVRKPLVLTELHGYTAGLAAFGKWVDHGIPYRCSALDALPVMLAVDGIYRSSRAGQRVAIEGQRHQVERDPPGLK